MRLLYAVATALALTWLTSASLERLRAVDTITMDALMAKNLAYAAPRAYPVIQCSTPFTRPHCRWSTVTGIKASRDEPYNFYWQPWRPVPPRYLGWATETAVFAQVAKEAEWRAAEPFAVQTLPTVSSLLK